MQMKVVSGLVQSWRRGSSSVYISLRSLAFSRLPSTSTMASRLRELKHGATREDQLEVARAEAPELERVNWRRDPGLRKLYFYAAILCIASATTGYDGCVDQSFCKVVLVLVRLRVINWHLSRNAIASVVFPEHFGSMYSMFDVSCIHTTRLLLSFCWKCLTPMTRQPGNLQPS